MNLFFPPESIHGQTYKSTYQAKVAKQIGHCVMNAKMPFFWKR
jgi:hypothetical protein